MGRGLETTQTEPREVLWRGLRGYVAGGHLSIVRTKRDEDKTKFEKFAMKKVSIRYHKMSHRVSHRVSA